MIIMEIQIKCPHCGSETRIVAQQVNPVIFTCRGCCRSVVVHNTRVFTVSVDYMRELMTKYKHKPCGQIIASKLSSRARTKENDSQINNLHDLLSQNLDVSDFLKEI